MNYLMPDLSRITSPCSPELSKAVSLFRDLVARKKLSRDECIALSIYTSEQIFSAFSAGNSIADHLLLDHHQSNGAASQFLTYFPVYACLFEHHHQKKMVEGLHRLMQPFSALGTFMPQGITMIADDEAAYGHHLPMVLNRSGRISIRPSMLIGLFGQSDFFEYSLNPVLEMEGGLINLLCELKHEDLHDRVSVESLVHGSAKFSSGGILESKNYIEMVNGNILPESRVSSIIHTLIQACVAPISNQAPIRSIASAIEEIPERNRKVVFDQLRISLFNSLIIKAFPEPLRFARNNLAQLFRLLAPLGFCPFDQMGSMGFFETVKPDDPVKATVRQSKSLHDRDTKPMTLAWLDGALMSLDADKVLDGKPSDEVAAHIYRVSGDPRYRPYLLRSARGRESVFAGDLSL